MAELVKVSEKSERSVRMYLDEIQREYPELGVTRGGKSGIWLDTTDAMRQKTLSALAAYGSQVQGSLERRQRHWYMLKTLFLERYTYTIQLFADELFCSKSTITQDLAEIEQWLAQRNLRLQRRQNQGIWLEGEEKELRLAFKALLDEMRQTGKGEALPPEFAHLDYRIDIVNYNRIAKLLPNVDLFLIQRMVQEAEQELQFYFTEQAFQNLVVHLAIAVKRIDEHKFMEHFQMAEHLQHTSEYTVARHMIERLEQALHIHFTEAEIAYAAVHILGAKIQLDVSGVDVETLIAHYGEQEVSLAKEVIRIASGVLRMDFGGDEKLLIRLVQHLRPTIVRMRQGLSLVNPMLEAIKREYAAAFAAAWAANSAFERVVGLPLNEDEVAYIAIHLIAGIQEYQQKYRAIIVCASGIGTSQMLVNRLAQYFPNLEIQALLPYNKLTTELTAQADIVISTIRLPEDEKTVCVSVLLTEDERNRIRRSLCQVAERGADKRVASSAAVAAVESASAAIEREILVPEFCFFEDDSQTFPALIRKYGALLEEVGAAKAGFTEDVIQRENIGSTYIGHGICIPHARTCFVLRTKIIFVRLKKPIALQQESVGIVLLLCLNFSDAQSTVYFFRNLYAVLSDEDRVRELYETKDKEKIAILLNGGIENA